MRPNGYLDSVHRYRMKRPRFTIAEIILFVLVFAIGLAAIRSGSDAWTGAILSVTYFTLFCSLLGIAFGRRGRRVYWVGFALLGWVYLALYYVPWQNGESIGEGLLAPNFFEHVAIIVHPDPPAPGGLQSLPPAVVGGSAVGGGFGGGPGPSFADMNARANVIRIGSALEALLWAFLGGWVARYFASGPEGAARSHAVASRGKPLKRPPELAERRQYLRLEAFLPIHDRDEIARQSRRILAKIGPRLAQPVDEFRGRLVRRAARLCSNAQASSASKL